MKNLQIKGRGKNIELCFSDSADISKLDELLGNRAEFFNDSDVRISYSGIKLSYKEEMTLEKELKKFFGNGVALEKKHRLSKAQIEYSLKENEKICVVAEKSLRSGDVLESRGDVLIFGDVNPGALIKADGNITVIGALRGAAHIRHRGKVYATYMQPSQIIIGKVCSYNKNTENVGSAVAIAENGEIILQRL